MKLEVMKQLGYTVTSHTTGNFEGLTEYSIEDRQGEVLASGFQDLEEVSYYIENIFIPEHDFVEVNKREYEIVKREYEKLGIGHYEGSYHEIMTGLADYYHNDIEFAYIEMVKHHQDYLIIEEAI